MNWIPVGERLPDFYKDVNIVIACDFDGKQGVASGFRMPADNSLGYEWRQMWSFREDDAEIDEVTHWQPLPEPPK